MKQSKFNSLKQRGKRFARLLAERLAPPVILLCVTGLTGELSYERLFRNLASAMIGYYIIKSWSESDYSISDKVESWSESDYSISNRLDWENASEEKKRVWRELDSLR